MEDKCSCGKLISRPICFANPALNASVSITYPSDKVDDSTRTPVNETVLVVVGVKFGVDKLVGCMGQQIWSMA